MDSKQIGILGEKTARKYLEKKDYQILDKNYSPHFLSGPKRGEIDVIAKKEDTICFVEVKSSRGCPRGTVPCFPPASKISPEMRVNFRKRNRIIKMAESWLRENKVPLDSKWQLDVISVIIDSGSRKAKVRHFKNV